MLLFAEYPWSTIGPYNEVAQALVCTYNGQLVTYAVRLHVTTDRALTMGRECGGFAKKLGDIPFVIGAKEYRVLAKTRHTIPGWQV